MPTSTVITKDVSLQSTTEHLRSDDTKQPFYRIYLKATADSQTSRWPEQTKSKSLRTSRSHLQSDFYNRSTSHSNRSPTAPYTKLSPKGLLPLPSPILQRRSRAVTRLQRAFRSQGFWLSLYFVFNLSLTLYNKGILGHFPFPYTLTAIHSMCGTVGGYLVAKSGLYKPAELTRRQSRTLGLFSVLYAINIAVSNVSLGLVSIPTHQVVRASAPIFVLLFSSLLLDIKISRRRLITLVPVMVGVGLSTYGDYYFSKLGFSLTILGTVLAALKTIITNLLQSNSCSLAQTKTTSYRKPTSGHQIHLFIQKHLSTSRVQLHPLDLLFKMSPLALIQCLVYSYFSGEMYQAHSFIRTRLTNVQIASLVLNGVIAFGLNIVSFTANKKAGALSMAVAGNVKQVLTVLLAVVMFQFTITWTNALGISLTLIGGAWYASVEYTERSR